MLVLIRGAVHCNTDGLLQANQETEEGQHSKGRKKVVLLASSTRGGGFESCI
jgi:hypothetical protein